MVVGARARAVRRGTSIIYSLLPPGEVEDAGDHELAAAVGGGGGDDGGGAGVLIRRARAASRKRLETWRGVVVSFQILLRKFWLQLEVAGRERVDW